jgi:hypothetical protein
MMTVPCIELVVQMCLTAAGKLSDVESVMEKADEQAALFAWR